MPAHDASRRAKLNRALTVMLIHDLQANGAELIATMRTTQPLEYLKLISAVLESEENGDVAITALQTLQRKKVRPDQRLR